MKMRRGFVSNSSTSSFVVFGFEVDGDREGNEGRLRESLGLPRHRGRERIEDYYVDEPLFVRDLTRDIDVVYLSSQEQGALSDDRHIVGILLEFDEFRSVGRYLPLLIRKTAHLRELFGVSEEEMMLITGLVEGWMFATHHREETES